MYIEPMHGHQYDPFKHYTFWGFGAWLYLYWLAMGIHMF